MGKRIERTRASGTLTEAMFWAKIRAALRNASRWWKPISVVRIKARRKYVGSNRRQKYEYRCNKCKNWFSDKKISVDHIVPVGSLNCASDLPGFVERLFCEESGLQVLCTDVCHEEKTKNERNGKHIIHSKKNRVVGRTATTRRKRRNSPVKRRRVSKRINKNN